MMMRACQGPSFSRQSVMVMLVIPFRKTSHFRCVISPRLNLRCHRVGSKLRATVANNEASLMCALLATVTAGCRGVRVHYAKMKYGGRGGERAKKKKKKRAC